MKLGLEKNEVRIVPYDPEWKDEFSKVKKEIQSLVGIDENRIQHIGSTAIDGICAKPIIDILLGLDDVNEMDKAFERKLRTIGFYRLRVKRPNEVVFAKFADETFSVKTHFIHVVTFNEELWTNLIFFRDYLNENGPAKNEYMNIKNEYLRQNVSTDVNEYTDFKEQFVQGIFAKRLN